MALESIIFDLDGTLWDSTEGIMKGYNEQLKEMNIDKQFKQKDFDKIMGLLMEEIVQIMFPEFDKEEGLKVLKLCMNHENEYLRKHGGVLYPQLEETLQKLSERYRLFIVSNCQEGYIEAFLEAHHLGKYFTDFENAERTGKPKGDNIRLVMERNSIEHCVYVGDTVKDMEATIEAHVPFVYASYGFGKLKDCTYTLSEFKDLISFTEENHELF